MLGGGNKKMETVVLKVEGLDCPSCAKTVEKGLKKLKGIEKTESNFFAEKLTVTYDTSQLTMEEIETRLKKVGHPVTK